ncbi:MAG: universal stress protein [Chloroflexi bacterium]|nr:universal stress protein [Chloroflexota bacterium]
MLNHILVPLDGSPLAECVLPHAVALAQAFDARVTLLQVLGRTRSPSRIQSIDPLSWHIHKAESASYLDGLVPRLQKAGLQVEKALLDGRAAERIVEFAHAQNVSLIILSSHGKSGLSGWNISGVVQKIILRACIPTMIVRAYQSVSNDLTGLRYKRVLVPLDCSQRAECVLPLATTLARFHKSRLLLTHIVRKPEMPRRAPPTQKEIELVNQLTELNREEANKCLEQLQSRLHSDTQIRLLVDNSATAALHQVVKQENIDLVVMSAHGYSGSTKWPYGNTALNFIAYGTTPLLIVQDLSHDELESTQAEMAAREHKGH